MTSVKKAFDSGAIPASQSEHLSYAEKFFGIQRYSSLLSGDNKNPRRKLIYLNSIHNFHMVTMGLMRNYEFYRFPG